MCKWTDPISEDSVKPLSITQTDLRAHSRRDTQLCPVLWVRKEPEPSAWGRRVPRWYADERRETGRQAGERSLAGPPVCLFAGCWGGTHLVPPHFA